MLPMLLTLDQTTFDYPFQHLLYLPLLGFFNLIITSLNALSGAVLFGI